MVALTVILLATFYVRPCSFRGNRRVNAEHTLLPNSRRETAVINAAIPSAKSFVDSSEAEPFLG